MRFAFIGSNFIVDWFAAAAAHCEGFVLQTAYSRTKEQALENAEKWGANTAAWDLAQLANDPLVDAVYIASPNLYHKEQTEQMLRAGKHVLCEKPIVSCEEDLYPLLRIAEEQNLLLMEAMRPVHFPAIAVIQSLLPKLGTLRYAEFSYSQYSSRYEKFKNGVMENAFRPELCNGTLVDLGVYCIQWMLALFGPPRNIHSFASFFDQSIDVNGAALCDYGTMQVNLSYSKVHQSNRPAIIEGEEGTLVIEPFPFPQKLRLQLRNGEETEIVPETHPEDIVYELRHFMEMAKAPKEAESYQQLSALSLRVTDTIRKQCDIDFQRKTRR